MANARWKKELLAAEVARLANECGMGAWEPMQTQNAAGGYGARLRGMEKSDIDVVLTRDESNDRYHLTCVVKESTERFSLDNLYTIPEALAALTKRWETTEKRAIALRSALKTGASSQTEAPLHVMKLVYAPLSMLTTKDRAGILVHETSDRYDGGIMCNMASFEDQLEEEIRSEFSQAVAELLLYLRDQEVAFCRFDRDETVIPGQAGPVTADPEN